MFLLRIAPNTMLVIAVQEIGIQYLQMTVGTGMADQGQFTHDSV